jgi:1-acyl-sn-glycerol-3-phosphate acyltransferase
MSGLFRKQYQDPVFVSAISGWHRGLCKILGVNITVYGQLSDDALLLVSNHISWLDISIYGATFSPSFLSKAGVKNWPVIGWLATQVGTLYIKRGKKGEAEQAKNAIISRMNEHGRVLFFPEGTTSSGESILRFHPRLFASALDAEVSVQPLAVCYPHKKGVNPVVPYIGDMTLLRSVWQLLSEPEIVAEVYCLSKITYVNATRETMARQASYLIRSRVESRHKASDS